MLERLAREALNGLIKNVRAAPALYPPEPVSLSFECRFHAGQETGAFDLSRFLVGPLTLKYAGQQVTPDADGKVTVHPDTPYQIDLRFKEKPDETDGQIPSGKELMFKLPEGIQAYPNQKGKLDIETASGTVSNNDWEIRDNVLYLKLSEDSRLTASRQAEFFVTIDV